MNRFLLSMMNRYRLGFLIILGLLTSTIGWAGESNLSKVNPEELSPEFRHFYDLTYWIMTDAERETFLRLQNDPWRKRFIDLFWAIRDPTPGTPENEYRDEMNRRFAYVNRYFRFASIPGWKTDRGRVYMKLGAPRSTERFNVNLELYDTEVWYYYGEGQPGLPSHFSVLFYRPHGTGDFKQYSYIADGPYELLIHKDNLDPFNYAALYEKIKEFEPTLAPVVLSPVPGEIPYNFQPTPEADQMMARIMESPTADIDDSYALKFESYAGLIELEEANRYIQARYDFRFQWMPELGFYIFQYVIQPGTVSIGQYEGQNYFVFDVNLQFENTISHKAVLQVNKQFRSNLDDTVLKSVKAGGLALLDHFPILPGNYHLKILLKNSVNREFSFWEVDLNIPVKEYPFMDSPIMAYDAQPGNPTALVPFQVGVYRYSIDLTRNFGIGDKIVAASRIYTNNSKEKAEVNVRLETDNPRKKPETVFSRTVTPIPATVPNSLDWLVSIPLETMVPGRYVLKTELKVGGLPRGQWRLPLSVSAARGVAHPVAFIKSLPWSNVFLWNLMAGDLAARLDQLPNAIEWYKRSVAQRPDYFPAVKRLLDAFILAERYEEALQFIQQAQGISPDTITLYRLLAQQDNAINCKASLSQFVNLYNKGYRHWRLMREIGLCLYHQGKKDQARPFLQDTFQSNPNQQDILPLLESVSESSSDFHPNPNYH